MGVDLVVVGDARELIMPKETFEDSIRSCDARTSRLGWVIDSGSPAAVMSLSFWDLTVRRNW